MASTACSSIALGPSVSGKPWPRLTAPVCWASAVISAKIVVPNPRIRSTSGSDNVWPMASCSSRLAEPGEHSLHDAVGEPYRKDGQRRRQPLVGADEIAALRLA